MRLVPIALGLIISFVSDTSYTINDVRETLPGYLALLLHILSTGAFEHFRSLLVPTVGSKYISVCCTVGAAAVGLIAYTTRELLVGRSRLLFARNQFDMWFTLDERAAIASRFTFFSSSHPPRSIFFPLRA